MKKQPSRSSIKKPFRRIAILGPGLLGGSIGRAAVRYKLAREVVMWGRRIESSRAAVRLKAATFAAVTPQEAVQGADLVVLCTPVGAMPELARSFRSKLLKGAIVTDVGSTKYEIVKQLSTILAGRATFIGSHPMAGSEKDGLEASRADLFEGSVCILTPLPRTRTIPLVRLTEFWEALGCSMRSCSPAAHDEIVAYISHLPHLVAAALVNLVNRRNDGAFDFIGNGFRDSTRIAGGPAEMWSEIVLSNQEEIRRSLDLMIEELETIRRDVANSSLLDLRTYLRQAKQKREELKHRF
jgi:cyclohexadieny/prephenate dehydrogenase